MKSLWKTQTWAERISDLESRLATAEADNVRLQAQREQLALQVAAGELKAEGKLVDLHTEQRAVGSQIQVLTDALSAARKQHAAEEAARAAEAAAERERERKEKLRGIIARRLRAAGRADRLMVELAAALGERTTAEWEYISACGLPASRFSGTRLADFAASFHGLAEHLDMKRVGGTRAARSLAELDAAVFGVSHGDLLPGAPAELADTA